MNNSKQRQMNLEKDLQRIGVVNQTTQLATDTQAIAEYLKNVMLQHYKLDADSIDKHFADTRDTLCYATSDNQSSVNGLLEADADLAIVVGGYNSSNTSHLVELCAEKLPTYFINDADKLISHDQINHCDWQTKKESITENYLPQKNPLRILITSGASCPDAIVEDVIRKLSVFYNAEEKLDEYIHAFTGV